jgi:hypothetical protein
MRIELINDDPVVKPVTAVLPESALSSRIKVRELSPKAHHPLHDIKTSRQAQNRLACLFLLYFLFSSLTGLASI